MRALFLIALFFATTQFLQAQTPEPILYLAFDGSVVDSSGLHETIDVIGGSYVSDYFGNDSNAFNFDQEDKISISNLTERINDFNNDFTLMFWAKLNDEFDLSTSATVFEVKDSNDEGFRLELNSGGDMKFDGLDFFSNSNMSIGFWTIYRKEEWVHIALTAKGDTLSAYKNGRFYSSVSDYSLPNELENSELTIGSSTRSASRDLLGVLDEIKIFDKALSANEIRAQENFGALSTENTVVIKLPFENNINDKSEFNHQVIASGGELTADRFGESDNAFKFNSDTDAILIPSNNQRIYLDESYSVSFWITLDTYPNTEAQILGKPTYFGSISDGFRISITENRTLRYRSPYGFIETKIKLPQNQWIHITAIFDGQYFYLYQNGIRITDLVQHNRPIPLFRGDQNFYLGSPSNSNLISRPPTFIGSLDEVLLFNYNITEDEISSMIDYVFEEKELKESELLSLPFNGIIEDKSDLKNEIESNELQLGLDRFDSTNSALKLDGTEILKVKSTGNLLDSIRTEFTFASWVKMDWNSQKSWSKVLFSRVENPWSDGIEIRIIEDFNNQGSYINLNLNGTQLRTSVSSDLITGHWNHITITSDGEFIKVYLNGELFFEESFLERFYLSDSDLNIGGNGQQDQSILNLIGSIDEVKVYNYAISEDSINSWYDLDDVSKSYDDEVILKLQFTGSVNDSSENNSSVINNGALLSIDRFRNQNSAVRFSEGENHILVEDNSEDLDAMYDAITLSAWVKIHNYFGKPQTVIQRISNSGYDQLYLGIKSLEITKNGLEGTIEFKVNNSNLSFRDGPVIPGEWFHIAGTLSDSEMKLYINGELRDSLVYSGKINFENSDVYVGNNYTLSNPFIGWVDDVKINNYALSDSAIAAMIDVDVLPVPNEESSFDVPSKIELFQNFPNPFNPSTNIEFSIPNNQDVQLLIYDTLGRVVGVLVDGALSRGRHVYTFDASGLSTGIYFYQLKTSNEVLTRKMLLIK